MFNKKTLLPLLAFAGALFVIYSIAQASDAEHPADDVTTIKEGKNPCHPDMPEKPKNPCHPENPCHPMNPCHHSADNSHQDDDHEQAQTPDPEHSEEDAH